ncbi:MAG: hypothetical protein PWP58_1498, partial [Bacillota bacterium]|nr:hypothetical protein [Bacillota bacterium]
SFGDLILARLPLLPDDVYGRAALDEVVALLARQIAA